MLRAGFGWYSSNWDPPGPACGCQRPLWAQGHTGGTRPCEYRGMDEYLIGAGALLTAGPAATIRGASLHAQPTGVLARQVAAALIDFESAGPDELSRLLIVAAGWTGSRFHAEVVARLLALRECGLSEVITALADAVQTKEVHLFARWLPDQATVDLLERDGIRLIPHSLDALGQAALVTGQRVERWRAPVRAA